MIEIQRITPILAYQENNKQNERNQKILFYRFIQIKWNILSQRGALRQGSI